MKPTGESLLVAKATSRKAGKAIGKSGSSIRPKMKARGGRVSGHERGHNLLLVPSFAFPLSAIIGGAVRQPCRPFYWR